jgi:hypothetical protein
MNLAKSRAYYTLLPDVCQITYIDQTGTTINRQGVLIENNPRLNRQYNLSNDIPCRADVVRAFRPDALDYEVTVVDELDLHLPHDMFVEEEDIVTLNGDAYKIRKLDNDSEWEVTRVVKIMRVSTEL